MRKADYVWVTNINSGKLIPSSKGNIEWIAWWWPWAKVAVHDLGYRWVRKSFLLERGP